MEQLIPDMMPAPGERLMRFIGDRVRFALKDSGGRSSAKGWQARLRTNLGRAEVLRRGGRAARSRCLHTDPTPER